MSHATLWIAGSAIGLLGLIGLYLASRAVDGGIYGFGLLLFLFAVLFDFWLMKRCFDERQRH